MSLSKFILNHNLIDADNLAEVVADSMPEDHVSYWENIEVIDIINDYLKIKVGDDWDPDDNLHTVEFKINNEGNLEFISYKLYVEE